MQRGKILFKALGVLAGLVFLIYGFSERSDITRFQKNGKSAVVEPITTYTEFKSRGSSTLTAEIRFKTEDGRQIAQKHSFPEELLADFKAGTPVRVLYLPNEPGSFIFEKERPGWTLIIVGAVIAVAALLFA